MLVSIFNVLKGISVRVKEIEEAIAYLNKEFDIDISGSHKAKNSNVLFVTCDEFQKMCEDENYESALELETKLNKSFSKVSNNFETIKTIAFF